MYDKIINESNKAHCINYLTLTLALLEKGIINDDEFAKARNQATHIIDQEWARKQEDAEKEFDKRYPGLKAFFGKVFGTEEST